MMCRCRRMWRDTLKGKLINNGLVLLEQGNLVHLRNQAGVGMVFEAASVRPGELVLVPLDSKQFNGDALAVDKFVTGKPIIKGLIEYGNLVR